MNNKVKNSVEANNFGQGGKFCVKVISERNKNQITNNKFLL